MVKITATVELENAYSVEETAHLLGKGRATIWRWIKAKKINPIRFIKGRTLIPKSEIERLKSERFEV